MALLTIEADMVYGRRVLSLLLVSTLLLQSVPLQASGIFSPAARPASFNSVFTSQAFASPAAPFSGKINKTPHIKLVGQFRDFVHALIASVTTRSWNARLIATLTLVIATITGAFAQDTVNHAVGKTLSLSSLLPLAVMGAASLVMAAISVSAVPFKNKYVVNIPIYSRQQRVARLKRAGGKVGELQSSDVTIDLETDSGMAAMSHEQWAATLRGDEAYAGSRSFRRMEKAFRDTFGFRYLIPAHQGRGAKAVLNEVLLKKADQIVIGNHIIDTTAGHVEHQKARAIELPVGNTEQNFRGNIDTERLREALVEHGDRVAYILMNVTDNFRGGQPVSMENLKAVRLIAQEFGIQLVGDISYFAENAGFIQRREPGYADVSVATIVHEMMDQFDIVEMSCKKDASVCTGGFVAMRSQELYNTVANPAILREGYLTYGGIAGYSMEAIAQGLREAVQDEHVAFRLDQMENLGKRLKAAGVPVIEPIGGHAIFIDAREFPTNQPDQSPAEALATLLYLEGGIRGEVIDQDTFRLSVPARVYTESHIDHVVESMERIYNRVFSQNLVTSPPSGYIFEPYKVAAFEPVAILSRSLRRLRIALAGLNLFKIDSKYITIDLLTDSGTGAMSLKQVANMIQADSSGSLRKMERFILKRLGFPHVLAVHQGRGAEQVLNEVMMPDPGKKVVGNRTFDTTTAHIETRQAEVIELPIVESMQTGTPFDFKGNIDLARLEATLRKDHADVAYVLMTITDNSGGGQPVSMANIKAARAIAKKYGLPFFGDIARFAENAMFIKEREPGYEKTSIQAIVRETMDQFDVVQMSSKKDAMIPMGGFLAVRDEALFARLHPVARLREGEGLSAAGLEALVQGMEEVLDENYLRSRLSQARYLGEKLKSLGIPIVEPVGGHAVFIDAKRFLPHIPPEQFPAQALGVELYIESGARPVEIGSLLAGRHMQGPQMGQNKIADLELLRLTLPRRAYTKAHMDYIAYAVKRVHDRRYDIRGLELTYEPPVLRHFNGRFRWVDSPESRRRSMVKSLADYYSLSHDGTGSLIAITAHEGTLVHLVLEKDQSVQIGSLNHQQGNLCVIKGTDAAGKTHLYYWHYLPPLEAILEEAAQPLLNAIPGLIEDLRAVHIVLMPRIDTVKYPLAKALKDRWNVQSVSIFEREGPLNVSGIMNQNGIAVEFHTHENGSVDAKQPSEPEHLYNNPSVHTFFWDELKTKTYRVTSHWDASVAPGALKAVIVSLLTLSFITVSNRGYAVMGLPESLAGNDPFSAVAPAAHIFTIGAVILIIAKQFQKAERRSVVSFLRSA